MHVLSGAIFGFRMCAFSTKRTPPRKREFVASNVQREALRAINDSCGWRKRLIRPAPEESSSQSSKENKKSRRRENRVVPGDNSQLLTW
jgi:hypothetical protein